MDLSGPFALSKDEFCEVRCILVGVLAVPIIEKKPVPVIRVRGRSQSLSLPLRKQMQR